MDKYRKLSELLKGMQPPQTTDQVFFTATMVSVEGTTCTVKIDDLELSEVRLKATETATSNQVVLIPKPGCEVLVGSQSGDLSSLFVIHCDIIDKIEITCNGQNVMVLLSDWLKTLAGAKIIVGNSTGTFEPSVISKLNSIETQFKQIFK